MKKFNLVRAFTIEEVLEVEAIDVADALALANLQEARLLTTRETEPVVTICWEKPTGLTDPNE